jgi:Mrp family chromosome partitioning ATPase/capsular polysaccharide biosynthesis protein
MSIGNAPPDLHEYLGILWRRKWFVGAIVAVAVAAALVHSSRQVPVYQSSTEVLVQPTYSFVGGQSPQAGVILMEDERRVATSSEVTSKAASVLRQAGTPMGAVSVQATETSHTLVFTAVSGTPLSAQKTAQAFADSYLWFREKATVDALTAAREPVERQLREIDRQLQDALQQIATAPNDSRRTAAVTRYTNLLGQQTSVQQSLSQLPAPSGLRVGEVLRPAPPGIPGGASRSRTVVLALFVGLSLGVGGAFLRDRLDQRVGSRHDLESLTGVPVVAVVPRPRAWRRLPAAGRGGRAVVDAYRTLAQRVVVAASHRQLTTLVVTSFEGAEQKTVVTANVAFALAESGRNVLILDAEPEKQELERHLSTYLGLEETELDVPRRYPEKSINDVDEVDNPWSNLWLVSARVTMIPLAVNPADLGTGPMRELIDELQKAADIVLIDAAPILQTPDVLALAPVADAVLCVTDGRRTTRGVITDGMLELHRMGADVFGLVLTNFRRDGARGFGAFHNGSSGGHRRIGQRRADQHPRQSP